MERIKRAFALQLDFAKTSSITTNYTYKQYDYGANEIGVQILFDGEVVQLDDEKVFSVFKNGKGELFFDNNNQLLKSYARIYSAKDGLIILPLPTELMQTAGTVIAELMIVANDHSKRLTSASFKFDIVESIAFLDLTGEKPISDTICGSYKCGEVLCGNNPKNTKEGYSKTIWIDGETVIDAEKLNKIEDTLYNLSNNENIIQELLTRIATLEEKLDELQNNVPSKPPVSEGTDIEVVDNEMLINISDVSYDEHLEELTITHSKVTYIAEEQALIINKK